MVDKLIRASCKPKNVSFPSGDDIAIGGWDGILEVEEGNEFVPSGHSGWEFGTNASVKGKADGDYAKRLAEPAPLDPKRSTFVFVTSRLWTRCDKWVSSKKSAKEWGNVIGLNAEKLSSWLLQCPAVHRWFAELIGKRTSDTRDVGQAWEAHSSRTETKLTPEFFLYGRDSQVNCLSGKMRQQNNVIRVASESADEAYGFVLSTILQDENASARSLIVRNQDGWDAMAPSPNPLILIPYGFIPNEIGAATNSGHTVVIVATTKSHPPAEIILGRLQRMEKTKAFAALGFDEATSHELYRKTKGYFEPLLRHPLMKPIDYVGPEWPQQISADALFAILFASEWNKDNENDRNALESLSGMTYGDFEKIVLEVSKADDPPVRLIGSIWQVISKMDFFLRIAHLASQTILGRFVEVMNQILSDEDPGYDLPEEERHLASFSNETPQYSNNLKEAVADTAALLAAHIDDHEDVLGATNPSSIIHYAVRSLFESNQTTKHWYSLGSCTQLLAEAAPEEYLTAVENASTGEPPALLGLFEAEGAGVFGGCYHSNLLWGLEGISWNKQYLSRVAQCLAKLSQIDPGGSYSNRPFSSLCDMFLGWINNTNATHDERLEIVDKVLIPQFPDVAWKLMVELLVDKHSTTSGIHEPEYRDWAQAIEQSTTVPAYYGYVYAMVDLLIREFNNHINRDIVTLISEFDSYKPDQRDAIVDKFMAVDVESLDPELRHEIRNKFRETISRHREFSDVKWAWPEALLVRLEAVHDHFKFQDLVEDNVYLFDKRHAPLIDAVSKKDVSYDERDALVRGKRREVIEAIYMEYDMPGITQLADTCADPYLVGEALYDSSMGQDVSEMMFEWVEGDGVTSQVAKSFISSWACRSTGELLELFDSRSEWDSVMKATILLNFLLTEDTLERIEQLDEAGQREYWSKALRYYVRGDKAPSINIVARRLLENDRPLAAIDTIAMAKHARNPEQGIDCELASEILLSIIRNPADIEDVPFASVQYHIQEVIQVLQGVGSIDDQMMIEIEWNYLRMFRFDRFTPIYLFKKVAADPAFFAQLVSWIYKKEELAEAEQEQRKLLAEKSFTLLDKINLWEAGDEQVVSREGLSRWVEQVRLTLLEENLTGIGDDRIGHCLSHCPEGADGIWPHENVRHVIEAIKSKELDVAVQVGRSNSRGATSRAMFEGGDQERNLADKYQEEAEKLQLVFPRTATILRSLASSYDWDAKRHDQNVELY
ncbi:hypothetical protein [Pontiella desulfatans]|uniref:hypothetical protein n=1 Tax=Pontiella desulfatans TaxID=2750659 RepID=UPI0014444C5B|nr:hypothetical protein [Pontiella desulfatans]